MTQNQSGKQLFEWIRVTTKEELPPDQDTYHIRWKSRFDERVFHAACGRIGMTRLLVNDAEYIEWLSPAQPSTGKQLPTDEEIDEKVDEYMKTYMSEWSLQSVSVASEAFVQGVEFTKQLFSSAQGESDKWIRVEDGLPGVGQEVIVYCPESKKKVTALCRFYRYEGATSFYWDNYYGGSFTHIQEAVTHWQPLPNAPITNNQK